MKTWLLTLLTSLNYLFLSACWGQTLDAPVPGSQRDTGLEFIHTSFENASPLYWEIDPEGTVQVYLVYDRERSSPNRANGHWHFQLQAKPGSKLKIVLNNLENVWNGKKASPASTMVAVSKRMLSGQSVGFSRKPVVDGCPQVEPHQS